MAYPETVNITDPEHAELLKRPVEPDTRIVATKFVRIGGIPVLLESWLADGVHGKSAVLLTRHVGSMSDDDLQGFLEQHGQADLGGVTVSRTSEFVFVNFGFEAM
jgi:hypothetical protein